MDAMATAARRAKLRATPVTNSPSPSSSRASRTIAKPGHTPRNHNTNGTRTPGGTGAATAIVASSVEPTRITGHRRLAAWRPTLSTSRTLCPGREHPPTAVVEDQLYSPLPLEGSREPVEGARRCVSCGMQVDGLATRHNDVHTTPPVLINQRRDAPDQSSEVKWLNGHTRLPDIRPH